MLCKPFDQNDFETLITWNGTFDQMESLIKIVMELNIGSLSHDLDIKILDSYGKKRKIKKN